MMNLLLNADRLCALSATERLYRGGHGKRDPVSGRVGEGMTAGNNKRAHIHQPHTFGQRAADTIANSMGSWPFIIWQSAIVGVWVVLNIVGFMHHWDVYPFILLNLLFSRRLPTQRRSS